MVKKFGPRSSSQRSRSIVKVIGQGQRIKSPKNSFSDKVVQRSRGSRSKVKVKGQGRR